MHRTEVFFNPPQRAVVALLAECGLPSSDLTPARLEHFFGCGSMNDPDGVVGIEIYGTAALLRSLAVRSRDRGRGFGRLLVERAEQHAASAGATEIYLLTTTADAFFERIGYARLDRSAAPEAIQRTEEFSSLCPASAVLLVKRLTSAPSVHIEGD